METNTTKVLFVQATSENEYETESLWCEITGNGYVIDNIPFIAKRVSLGDTVKAEFDEEDKTFYFDDFVAVSGNSTIRLYFTDTVGIETTRAQLLAYGCESEVLLQRKIVGVNIPKETFYRPIKQFLEDGERDGLWIYEESCLAHVY